ncbi:hypothetical protein L596_015623 [Steinernema carpocapsae]|uniref:Uncharacterized protein n=1 Tax=Steinernema carpocapsae TaxID=34508 RepID=A0A4U5NFI2_STECR|nr:hypothetical protein L596_015623 [Steinernema carpocapsae]
MDPKISFIPAAEAAVSPIVEEHVAKVEAVKEEENTEQVVEINNNQEGKCCQERERRHSCQTSGQDSQENRLQCGLSWPSHDSSDHEGIRPMDQAHCSQARNPRSSI